MHGGHALQPACFHVSHQLRAAGRCCKAARRQGCLLPARWSNSQRQHVCARLDGGDCRRHGGPYRMTSVGKPRCRIAPLFELQEAQAASKQVVRHVGNRCRRSRRHGGRRRCAERSTLRCGCTAPGACSALLEVDPREREGCSEGPVVARGRGARWALRACWEVISRRQGSMGMRATGGRRLSSQLHRRCAAGDNAASLGARAPIGARPANQHYPIYALIHQPEAQVPCNAAAQAERSGQLFPASWATQDQQVVTAATVCSRLRGGRPSGQGGAAPRAAAANGVAAACAQAHPGLRLPCGWLPLLRTSLCEGLLSQPCPLW